MSASNVPMAHLAATSFLLLCSVALPLFAAAIAFEIFYFISILAPKENRHPAPFKISTIAIFTSLETSKNWMEKAYIQRIAKKLELPALCIIIFAACYIGIQASVSMAIARHGEIILSAIVFEFDATPADRCELTEDEKSPMESNVSSKSALKVLFFSDSQEKAILVKNTVDLFKPINLKELNSENSSPRKLVFGRVVDCYKPIKGTAP